ncbi:CapA family protein [Streptomyces sioyaensis]|uniref:CapA family protein n=1 Tax=Streptomyces sioyaensis TaxID=67364 RepID=UPI003793ECE5
MNLVTLGLPAALGVIRPGIGLTLTLTRADFRRTGRHPKAVGVALIMQPLAVAFGPAACCRAAVQDRRCSCAQPRSTVLKSAPPLPGRQEPRPLPPTHSRKSTPWPERYIHLMHVGAPAVPLRQGSTSPVGMPNHINYGEEGLLGLLAALDTHGIPHDGAGRDLTEARRPVPVEAGGVRFGVLQRSSIHRTTQHAAEAKAPGLAVLPGRTACEVPRYRYNPAIPPVNNATGRNTIVAAVDSPDHAADLNALTKTVIR